MLSLRIDLDGWLSKVYRRSESAATLNNMKKNYRVLRLYFDQLGMKTDEQVGSYLSELKENGRVYKFLDDYAGYLSTKHTPKLMPGSVRERVGCAVNFLRYHEVKVASDEFRQAVTLPKALAIEDEIVKPEQLRKLLIRGSPLMCALILTLTSSGMRINEAGSVRVKDVDFKTFAPIGVISLHAKDTKAKTSRKVFISDEAVQALQMLVKGKPGEELIFFKHNTPNANDSKKLHKYFYRLLKNAELDQKIEGHKYYNLHLHNLGRKYFYSKMVGGLGSDATRGLMGHSQWWATYDKRPLDERAAEYKANMNRLYVMQAQVQKLDPREALRNAGIAVGFSFDSMERMMQAYKTQKGKEGLNEVDWARATIADLAAAAAKAKGLELSLPEEETMRRLREMVEGSHNKDTKKSPEDDPQVVVTPEEVENLLHEGWEFVANLPNGKVIVRK